MTEYLKKQLTLYFIKNILKPFENGHVTLIETTIKNLKLFKFLINSSRINLVNS